jgi:hypothetical protein
MRARSMTGSARMNDRSIGIRLSNVHCAAYSPARDVTSVYGSPSCRRKLSTAASGASPILPSRIPLGFNQFS